MSRLCYLHGGSSQLARYYKCYQRDCSYIGSDKAQALCHLLYHRDYSEAEVERLAGSDVAMAASLPRAEHLLYHNLDKEVVKAGPQAFADTGETLQVNNDNDVVMMMMIVMSDITSISDGRLPAVGVNILPIRVSLT